MHNRTASHTERGFRWPAPHLVQVCGAPRNPERHREPCAPAQRPEVQRGAQAAARRKLGDRDAVLAGRADAQQGDHMRVAQAR